MTFIDGKNEENLKFFILISEQITGLLDASTISVWQTT